MTTITVQDVSAWTAGESFYLYLVGLTKAATKHLALWIFFPVLLLMALFLAQAFPFRVLEAVRRINKVLPDIQDDAVLELVHDMYQLTFGAAHFYSKLCLFRGTMQNALSELDEALDSLSFVSSHKDELQGFLESSESRCAPNLPLPFERMAATN